MNIPDNFNAYARHEVAHEARLSRLPICDKCGEPIQSDRALSVGDWLICERCVSFSWVEVEECQE